METSTLFPSQGHDLLPSPPEGDIFLEIPFDVKCGKNGPGSWLSFGEADMAENQKADDSLSLSFTGKPLNKELSIVGFPRLSCEIVPDNHNGGVVIARLCDVSPENESTLITFGVLNLTHHKGHTDDKVKELEVGKAIDVNFNLHSIGYKLPEGHRLRLAVSASWWPYVWPSSKAVKMRMKSAKLFVPVYTGFENRKELVSIEKRLHLRGQCDSSNIFCVVHFHM